MSNFVPLNAANALVALGSNEHSALGDVRETLRLTINTMAKTGLVIRSVSRFYATPCFPAGAGPDFVNAAVSLEYAGSAASLLARLHEIEAEFGRKRVKRWGQRVLDLDLIAFGAEVHPDIATVQAWIDLPLEQQMEKAPDHLMLPHPRVQDRAFVLGPLMDIAPHWKHPILGLSVEQMYAALPEADRVAVKPLDNLNNRA